jgi:hypothetical protein
MNNYFTSIMEFRNLSCTEAEISPFTSRPNNTFYVLLVQYQFPLADGLFRMIKNKNLNLTFNKDTQAAMKINYPHLQEQIQGLYLFEDQFSILI